MSAKITVDAGRLREAAALLAEDAVKPPLARVDAGDIGGRPADAAFEAFRSYWSPGLDAVAGHADALTGALRAAADTYQRRDHADASATFTAGEGQFIGF